LSILHTKHRAHLYSVLKYYELLKEKTGAHEVEYLYIVEDLNIIAGKETHEEVLGAIQDKIILFERWAQEAAKWEDFNKITIYGGVIAALQGIIA